MHLAQRFFIVFVDRISNRRKEYSTEPKEHQINEKNIKLTLKNIELLKRTFN